MNLQTMRRLDLLVGIPAVFALKAVHAVLGLNRRSHVEPDGVRNLLLIKCFGMGSLLLERPFLQEARRVFPNARIHLLTFESNRALAELLPEVDEIYYITTKSKSEFGKSVIRNLTVLRRIRFDITFDQEFFSKFTTFCSLAIGAPWRVGYFLQARWRTNAYTHNAYFNSAHHVTLVFKAQIGYALEPPDQIKLELPDADYSQLIADLEPMKFTEEDAEVAASLPGLGAHRRTIAVNVNAGELSHLRRWPGEKFALLISELLMKDPDAGVILIGAPSECAYVDSVLRLVPDSARVTNACGRITVAQLMILLGRVDLLISNDSGPIHMAAVMGTDTISIFGPETPVLYGPAGAGRHRVLYRGIFCSPCLNVYNNKLTTCTDNVCINKLPVSSLMAEYRSWLEGKTAPVANL